MCGAVLHLCDNITMLGSAYHIEINPSDVGNYDRQVVQEIIKEMASTSALNAINGPGGGLRAALSSRGGSGSGSGGSSSSSSTCIQRHHSIKHSLQVRRQRPSVTL